MSDVPNPGLELKPLDLRSADVVEPRIKALAELFPEAVKDGKLDLDAMHAALGDVAHEGPERFGLSWPGKADAIRMAQRRSEGTLVPMRDESVEWDTTKNVIIEGENLEVLKVLQRSYHGKVKLIYIDPPYNTGKDFVYPDNFKDPLSEYLRYSGQIGEDGGRLRANAETGGRYHSAWLSMMWPRLHLARSLLRDDGVIVVSVDDVEVSRLRLLLDETFGEENFICQFVWNNEGNVDNQSLIKGVHEYLVCYARTVGQVARPTVIDPNIDEESKLYNQTIENSITKNGPANPPSVVVLPLGFPCYFEEGLLEPREDAWPHILDPVEVKGSRVVGPARLESGWSSRTLLDLFISNEFAPIVDSQSRETWFALTSTGAIYQYKTRADTQGHVLSVIRNVGTTKQTSGRLRRWNIEFSYPKPTKLVQYLTSIFSAPDRHDLVIDFFAGSGTTGHAVLAQNREDGGNRRFLLVQLPEPAGDDGTTTLADLCRRRVARAGAELCDLATASEHFDAGYRAYRLGPSGLRARHDDPTKGDIPLLTDFSDLSRSGEDLLTELLLTRGFALTEGVEWRAVAGSSFASVMEGALIATFNRELTLDFLESLASIRQ